jgi:hypothetical protein
LLTEEEVMAMVKQTQQAASQKQPSPDELKTKAETELDQAKTQEIIAKISGQHPALASQMAKDQATANKINADVAGTSADRQLEAISLIKQHKATNY